MVLKNKLRTPLLCLLAGCVPVRGFEVKKPGEIVKTESKEPHYYSAKIGQFSEYFPHLTVNKIKVNPSLERYLVRGLDVDTEIRDDRNPVVKNPLEFEKQIYADALDLGYTQEQINSFSPKQVVELIVKLESKRLNYFGRGGDFKSRRENDERLRGLTEIFAGQILKTSLESEADREIAKEYSDNLRRIVEVSELFHQIYDLEAKIGKSSGGATQRMDFMPLDEIYLREKEVCCRQFADLAVGIFNIIKINNPYLKNSYCAAYSSKTHRWNQLGTLEREGDGTVVIGLTFFDPTNYDVSGSIEGYNSEHFGDQMEGLRIQSKKMVIESNK